LPAGKNFAIWGTYLFQPGPSEMTLRFSEHWDLLLAVAGLTILLSFPLPSSGEPPAVIPPSEASRQVHLLTHSIDWQTSVEDAKKLARTQSKLIFWVHMLGQIDGKT
jgi:hypothetical protein